MKFRRLVWATPEVLTATLPVEALVQPDIKAAAPAAAPAIPRAEMKRLRFVARSAAILLILSTVAVGSKFSVSVLAIVWASLPVDVLWERSDCAMDGVGFRV